jgi:ankyrin repeat protein
LDLLRGRIDRLAGQLDRDPELVNRRFPELDCGQTGARNLLLQGATLLHAAAEYGQLEAARLLLDRGAQVDAQATVDENGIGGQTPLFHAVSQFNDWGFPLAQFLMERGAGLSIRAKLPGAYERPDEVVECTPLGYALRFPGDEGKTVMLLRERGAVE